MSIASEINRIKTNIANAYTQANAKGATLPESQNSANLASTIESISGLEVKHGIIATEVDEDGYVTKAKVVGLNTVPAYAFLSPAINEKLEKVELEDGITKIETQAFNLCSNLKEVNIPESVTSLEDNAFRYCSNIKNIELSKNIVTIGEYAFYICSSLKNINIPKNIKNAYDCVGRYAFYECDELEEIRVEQENDYLKSVDGALLTRNTYVSGSSTYNFFAIAKYPPKRKAESCTIETYATTVEFRAFKNATNLKRITLKLSSQATTNKQYILNNAFLNCSNLEKLIITNTDTTLTLQNVNAFSGTKIENGEGYIYVADSLVSSYKSKSNWSTFADQIKPLSGLEVQE